jgi:glycosyltransferase involved in cell wall biosynthesis
VNRAAILYDWPVTAGGGYGSVSILIPTYNEAATLEAIVARAASAPPSHDRQSKEIVIVDDGSRDTTSEAMARIMARAGAGSVAFKIATHPRNRGKGAALKTAIGLATGDIVIVQDADLEYDPGDYEALLKPILDDDARVVYGTRWPNLHRQRRLPGHWRFLAGSWLVTQTTNLLYGARLTRKAGHVIREVPIAYSPRSVAEGKKIRAIDGVRALVTLLRERVR